jgi:hypothetical protein
MSDGNISRGKDFFTMDEIGDGIAAEKIPEERTKTSIHISKITFNNELNICYLTAKYKRIVCR